MIMSINYGTSEMGDPKESRLRVETLGVGKSNSIRLGFSLSVICWLGRPREGLICRRDGLKLHATMWEDGNYPYVVVEKQTIQGRGFAGFGATVTGEEGKMIDSRVQLN